MLIAKSFQQEICSVTNNYLGTPIHLQGDDNAIMIDLPFNFTFYCNIYDKIGVSTNGLITFNTTSVVYTNTPTNSVSLPNNYIASFWSDLIVEGNSIYYYGDNYKTIIQWTNMGFFGTNIPLGTFQSILYVNGSIDFNYLKLLGSPQSLGSTATVGIKRNNINNLQISYLTQRLLNNLKYHVFNTDNCTTYNYSTSYNNTFIELITADIPDTPSLLNPLDYMILQQPIILSWTNTNKATFYKIYLSTSKNFNTTVYFNLNYTNNTVLLNNLINTTYYWKIFACNSFGCKESCTNQFNVSLVEYSPPSPNPPEPPPYIPPPDYPRAPPPLYPPNIPSYPNYPRAPPPLYPPNIPSYPNYPRAPPPLYPPNIPSYPNYPNESPTYLPPPPNNIEQVSVAISTAITTTVTTSIVTSITTSISTSVASSTASSSAVSPVGLLTMISSIQIMNMNAELGLGDSSNMLNSITKSTGWINFDYTSESENGRRLLQISSNSFDYSKKLIIYTYPALIIISIIHCTIQYCLYKYKNKKLTGLACFPQFELIIGMFLLNPYSKAAGQLFKFGTVESVFAGIGMLMAIPISLILFSSYIIYKYIIKTHTLKFLVFNNIQIVEGPVDFLKRSLFSSNNGIWKDKNSLVSKYGVLFKNIRGPIYVFTNKEIMWDGSINAYRWGYVKHIHEKFSTIRSFYIPLFMLRNMLLSLLLTSFPSTTTNKLIQTSLLVGLMFFHTYCTLLIIVPFNTVKDQFINLITGSCEFCLYLCGLVFIIYPNTSLEKILLSFQLGIIFTQIVGQIWGVVIILTSTGKNVFLRLLGRKDIEKEYFLGKKYFNRWKNNLRAKVIIEF